MDLFLVYGMDYPEDEDDAVWVDSHTASFIHKKNIVRYFTYDKSKDNPRLPKNTREKG